VQIAIATARMNHMAIAFADRSGTERGVDWSEGTGVVGADGWLRDTVGPGVGVAWADLDLPASRDKRQAELVDLFGDRRPDLYGSLLGEPQDGAPSPRSGAPHADGMSDANPAVDPPEPERPEADTKPEPAAVGEGTDDASTAPALRRRDSGGGDVMS
jgi:hypothetical protein